MCGVPQVEEADEGLVAGPCDGEDVGVKSCGRRCWPRPGPSADNV